MSDKFDPESAFQPERLDLLKKRVQSAGRTEDWERIKMSEDHFKTFEEVHKRASDVWKELRAQKDLLLLISALEEDPVFKTALIKEYERSGAVKRICDRKELLEKTADVEKIKRRVLDVFLKVFKNMSTKTQDVLEYERSRNSYTVREEIITVGSFGFGWRPKEGANASKTKSRGIDSYEKLLVVIAHADEIGNKLHALKMDRWALKIKAFAKCVPSSEFLERRQIILDCMADVPLLFAPDRGLRKEVEDSDELTSIPHGQGIAFTIGAYNDLSVLNAKGMRYNSDVSFDLHPDDWKNAGTSRSGGAFVYHQLKPYLDKIADELEQKTDDMIATIQNMEQQFQDNFGRELLLSDA